jgi:hypothetical protein
MEDQDIELIDQYLLGDLPADDVLLVETRLKNEPELQKLFEKMKILVSAAQKHQTRLKIKSLHEDKMEDWKSDRVEVDKSANFNFSILKWTSFAAAACLVGMLYLGNTDFKMPDAVSLQERGVGTNHEGNSSSIYIDFVEANKLLESKKYEEASELFEKVSNDENYMLYYREMSRWYQVVAMSEVDVQKAKVLFEELDKMPNTKYEIPVLEKLKMRLRLFF